MSIHEFSARIISKHSTEDEKAYWNSKSDFLGSYNDLTDAPQVAEDDSGELVVADESGNIIFRSGDNGTETTQLITNKLIVGGTDITEVLVDKVSKEELDKDVNDLKALNLM